MSLGVYLVGTTCPHCGCGGGEEEVTDGITYNLMPMFRAAGWDHEQYDGWTGKKMLPVAEKVLAALKQDPVKFEALNPSNGWGEYKDAVWFFRTLIVACKRFPKHTMRFYR